MEFSSSATLSGNDNGKNVEVRHRGGGLRCTTQDGTAPPPADSTNNNNEK